MWKGGNAYTKTLTPQHLLHYPLSLLQVYTNSKTRLIRISRWQPQSICVYEINHEGGDWEK